MAAACDAANERRFIAILTDLALDGKAQAGPKT